MYVWFCSHFYVIPLFVWVLTIFIVFGLNCIQPIVSLLTFVKGTLILATVSGGEREGKREREERHKKLWESKRERERQTERSRTLIREGGDPDLINSMLILFMFAGCGDIFRWHIYPPWNDERLWIYRAAFSNGHCGSRWVVCLPVLFIYRFSLVLDRRWWVDHIEHPASKRYNPGL